MTGAQIVHVPYKGGAAGIADLIGGQVQLMLEGMNSITPHAKAGRVRSLAVSGARRSDALPDVPTIAEAGVPGYEASTAFGVLAPAKTPRDITMALNREIVALLQAPDVKERFAAEGSTVIASTPEALRDHLRRDIAKWQKVVKAANIRLE
jgi:tripartite-type tricarboxylate transporter receptor subunit TctC